MIKRLVLALFLAVCAPAFAAVSNAALVATRSGASSMIISAASDGTLIASSSRSVVAGAVSGEMLIRDMLTAQGPAGGLPLTVTRTVSGAAVARAIATQAAKGILPVAIGLGAYEILMATRHQSGASGLEQDPGTDPVSDTRTVYCYAYSGPTNGLACDPVRVNACKMTLADYGRYGAGFSARFVAVESGTGTCIGEKTMPGQVNNDGTTYWGEYRIGYQGAQVVNTNGCPAIVDALTGESVIPGVSGDGKCATGRYNPITVEQSALKIAPLLTPAAIKDYAESPASGANPIPESKPMVVTGPATQVGQPVTTTATTPTGTRSETRTPTYQYNYAGNTVTYNTTNTTVTNVTNNAGDTTTQTETKPEPPQTGNCELYPDTVGCMKPGTIEDVPITPVQKSVSISQESVSLPSGCPGDVALPGGRVFSYAVACDAAQKMAPLVVAAGVLSALLIVVAAIRSN